MELYIENANRPIYRGTQIVWAIFGIITILLALRFVLKLAGANAAAGFTDLMYTITAPLVAPFAAVFGTSTVANIAFEWTTLLAMFVYWIIALIIINLFLMSRPMSSKEVATRLHTGEIM